MRFRMRKTGSFDRQELLIHTFSPLFRSMVEPSLFAVRSAEIATCLTQHSSVPTLLGIVMMVAWIDGCMAVRVSSNHLTIEYRQ